LAPKSAQFSVFWPESRDLPVIRKAMDKLDGFLWIRRADIGVC